jgi:hypothetical protein
MFFHVGGGLYASEYSKWNFFLFSFFITLFLVVFLGE